MAADYLRLMKAGWARTCLEFARRFLNWQYAPGPGQRFRGNFMTQKVKNREMGLDITFDTPVPNWCGEKMYNNFTVLGLLQLE